MKKLVLVLAVVFFFACSGNNEENLTSNPRFFIKVETVCKSGNTRKYEIKKSQYDNIEDYINNVGSDCTWVQVETVSNETKNGYFVELYKE